MNPQGQLVTFSGAANAVILPYVLTMYSAEGAALNVGSFTTVNGVQYRCTYSDQYQSVLTRV